MIAANFPKKKSPTQTQSDEHAVEIRIANTAEEYERAFRIAYDVYYPIGYTEYSPFGIRVTPAQLKPDTAVLLAYHREQAVATFSLYADGPEGIPSESFWRTEIRRLRDQGRRFYELGSLMVLPGHMSLGTQICMELFRAACLFIRDVKKADGICAFVTPKHSRFYEDVLGFQRLGEPVTYCWDGPNSPKVVPLFGDLAKAEQFAYERFEHWGDSPRNLYRFIFKNGGKVLRDLRADWARRSRMDVEHLRDCYERFLPAAILGKIV